jgi:hypothetical protein
MTVRCGEIGPARARIVGGREGGRARVRAGTREEGGDELASDGHAHFVSTAACAGAAHFDCSSASRTRRTHSTLLHMSWSTAIDRTQRTRPHAWSVVHAVTGKVVVTKVGYKKGSLKITYSLPNP